MNKIRKKEKKLKKKKKKKKREAGRGCKGAATAQPLSWSPCKVAVRPSLAFGWQGLRLPVEVTDFVRVSVDTSEGETIGDIKGGPAAAAVVIAYGAWGVGFRSAMKLCEEHPQPTHTHAHTH